MLPWQGLQRAHFPPTLTRILQSLATGLFAVPEQKCEQQEGRAASQSSKGKGWDLVLSVQVGRGQEGVAAAAVSGARLAFVPGVGL